MRAYIKRKVRAPVCASAYYNHKLKKSFGACWDYPELEAEKKVANS